MADVPMPDAIVGWIRQRNWGLHHLEWHLVRLWDILERRNPAAIEFARSQGWQRAARQEGSAGNGLDFLAMHRVMIRQLLAAFPGDAALFDGWPTPPTNPDDPTDPVPPGNERPFRPSMQAAVARIEGQPTSFAGDDDFGTYVETNLRPTQADPEAISTDPSTGIHNYLHNRFQDASSSINMGNPAVNLENRQFWRLHGWIDVQWTRLRQALGLSDADPAYQAALAEAEHHMGGHLRPLAFARAAVPAAVVEAIAAHWHFGDRKPADANPVPLDFESASVYPGVQTGTWVLVVIGRKPNAALEVRLVPRVYVRRPEYWEIDLYGVQPPGITIPVISPYTAVLDLEGALGTLGIEVVGATRRERIEVPPRERGG